MWFLWRVLESCTFANTQHDVWSTSIAIDKDPITKFFCQLIFLLSLILDNGGSHGSSKSFTFFHSKLFYYLFLIPLFCRNSFVWLLNLKTEKEWELTHKTHFKFTFHEICKIRRKRRIRASKYSIININLNNKKETIKFFSNKVVSIFLFGNCFFIRKVLNHSYQASTACFRP